MARLVDIKGEIDQHLYSHLLSDGEPLGRTRPCIRILVLQLTGWVMDGSCRWKFFLSGLFALGPHIIHSHGTFGLFLTILYSNINIIIYLFVGSFL